ncbi:hypothetical protein KUTeg_024472 [Tegillarca granosa]|uniref:Uncharacterized protein n=1 Tax=Tegillarca granosa TaxID=220873 RepID=A0ABQ9E2J5_TEGGR|nr:hypothetical protein KUTeg_024472 [Tegillarca granosa]
MHARDGNKCNRLFQRPDAQVGSLKWYSNVLLEHNTIGNLMPELSGVAKLSRRYTNHYSGLHQYISLIILETLQAGI